METSQFIDLLAAGEAAKAKDTLSDMMSAKAFDALENRKIEIAKSAFGGIEQENENEEEQVDIEVFDANEINGVKMGDIEVQDTEDTPV